MRFNYRIEMAGTDIGREDEALEICLIFCVAKGGMR
jgi:hypothetical protein